MKNKLKRNGFWAIWMISLATVVGACQKDKITDLPDEEAQLKEVTFRISGFKVAIHPLMRTGIKGGNDGNPDLYSISSDGNVPPSTEEQLLYFWSFNQESTVPDVGIDTTGTAIGFTSNHQTGKVSYVGGKAFSPYTAGQSYSVNGPNEIVFKIPISGVTDLGMLSFDIGSSNTGPKDFELFYSLDSEEVFVVLEEDNQFFNTTSSSWNRCEYDLSSLLLDTDAEILRVKLKLKSGDRGSGGEYNESTGTVRIDNFGLTGVYTALGRSDTELTGGTVHYHIFRRQDSTMVLSGQKTFVGGKDAVPQINVLLAEGGYFASFVVSFSKKDLIIPPVITQTDDFYMRNQFDNDAAIIYGTLVSELRVDQDTQRELILERLYSEVHFQFADDMNLHQVKKIRITEVQPVFYSPFPAGQMVDPSIEKITGTTSTTIQPDWSDDNDPGIYFHQFLGLRDQPLTVEYELHIYGSEDELLRNFRVQADLFHNTMLIFSGKLLPNSGEQEIAIPIFWNEDWWETKTIEF